jgi:hypothetical protein
MPARSSTHSRCARRSLFERLVSEDRAASAATDGSDCCCPRRSDGYAKDHLPHYAIPAEASDGGKSMPPSEALRECVTGLGRPNYRRRYDSHRSRNNRSPPHPPLLPQPLLRQPPLHGKDTLHDKPRHDKPRHGKPRHAPLPHALGNVQRGPHPRETLHHGNREQARRQGQRLSPQGRRLQSQSVPYATLVVLLSDNCTMGQRPVRRTGSSALPLLLGQSRDGPMFTRPTLTRTTFRISASVHTVRSDVYGRRLVRSPTRKPISRYAGSALIMGRGEVPVNSPTSSTADWGRYKALCCSGRSLHGWAAADRFGYIFRSLFLQAGAKIVGKTS